MCRQIHLVRNSYVTNCLEIFSAICLFLVTAEEAPNCVQYSQPYAGYNCLPPTETSKGHRGLRGQARETDVISIYRQGISGIFRLWERKTNEGNQH
jgi:hypothetical protein